MTLQEQADHVLATEARNRHGAIGLIAEFLDLFLALSKSPEFTADDRRKFATRMADAVIALTRQS